MAIFNENDVNNSNSEKADKVAAKVYINVGVPLVTVGEDGKKTTEFVSLPFGLAADTMSEMKATGSNQNWRKLVQAKNQLLRNIVEQGNALEPGTSTISSYLQVEIRHTSDATANEPDQDENDFLSQLALMSKSA